MPYVMVPVPEEHVQEAMEAILRITRQAQLNPWDAESIDQFFRAEDEPSKALLTLVARASRDGKQLTSTATASPSSSRTTARCPTPAPTSGGAGTDGPSWSPTPRLT